MKTIILDIETHAPGWKEDVRGWEPGSFAPTAYHEPVVIAWLFADHGQKSGGKLHLEAHRVEEDNEATILSMLAADFRDAGRLVTWNGRNFDMPVLSCRALALDVDWSWWHNWRHRFPNYKKDLLHYDLMDQLGDYGAARGLRQDRVAKICGLPGKSDDIDGSKVGEMWAAGKHDEVVDYCVSDVLDLYGIYLRFAHVFLGVSLTARDSGLEALRLLREEK